VKSLPSGAVVELLATDPGSIKDVAAWCRATGNELVEQTSDGQVFRFAIRRK
jgi:tRNA 2-thiouridine synthesizing protein A